MSWRVRKKKKVTSRSTEVNSCLKSETKIKKITHSALVTYPNRPPIIDPQNKATMYKVPSRLL